ncbi:AAA family ATPase [Meiothermus sp.]|uniref:AAA family ATPase n=1 Tax=Meiothermus sp. TaxID=1955249 RepID=UPI0021DC5DF0|nr:AAA family ATPase [Meiothermus sp.]GIW35553.1 MAG: hypothetical protein KatS3mg072_2886 [Meiothermus sp.]
MKIERLILQGFKSFGERTSLEFGPGIYGIVGPNGSGKSNLVEALRWVVGARARELRGEEALSLLFHGADGRAPLGFAEVGLELGGNGRRVNLSRRLERDGSSDVRLNGSRSTLRQVEQALMGTGLSRTGYAIVGQGEVGQILQAGPEVLLSYLEEAAGLRAVTQASKTAHERLESATLELQTRAQELAERKASVAEKAQQAEAAQKAAYPGRPQPGAAPQCAGGPHSRGRPGGQSCAAEGPGAGTGAHRGQPAFARTGDREKPGPGGPGSRPECPQRGPPASRSP